MKQKCPLVSVVITTKNEEKNIQNCLQSIKNQTYGNIEIIVVDNGSDDQTQAIAKRYTAKVFTKGPERSAQRNFGAKRAKGKYYLYIDADMTLSIGVINDCVNMCEHDSTLTGLYIPEKITGTGFWNKVRNFERGFYNGTVIDCVRFVPLNIFKKTGGFDTALTGPEDWDFDKKVRNLGKIGIIQSHINHNECQFDLSKYLSKKSYYAKSMGAYARKWGQNDPDVKKQLGAYYRMVGVFIENGKWKRLKSKPVLTVGVYLLRMMVGLSYIIRRTVYGFS